LGGIRKNKGILKRNKTIQTSNRRFEKSLIIEEAQKVLGRALTTHGPEALTTSTSHHKCKCLLTNHDTIMGASLKKVKRGRLDLADVFPQIKVHDH
jgi:hypothetical protein